MDNFVSSPSEIISGHAISFDHGIAIECGINAAIIYNHIIYWIIHNKNTLEAQKEGKIWMYETQEKMAEYFRFFDSREIKYSIKKLVECGLLVKKNFNKNRFDHTNWYSLPDDIYEKIIQRPKTKDRFSNNSSDSTNLPPSEGTNLYPSYKEEDKQKNNKNTTTRAAASSSKHDARPASSPSAVVVSSLLKLNISDKLRKKLSRDYSKEEVDKAVDRCLKWKDRKNDQVGIITCLKMADEWTDCSNSVEDNLEYLGSLKCYDGRLIANTRITIGHNYIEFVRGNICHSFSVKDSSFKNHVQKIMEELYNYEKKFDKK